MTLIMRWKFSFVLSAEKLNQDYRRPIISYFKRALTSYENGKYFDTFYSEHAVCKPFACSLYFGNAKFSEQTITVPRKEMDLFFSTHDYAAGITMYNALRHQKGNPFPLSYQNMMILTNSVFLPVKKIQTDQIHIKMMSPLCIRIHERSTNKDTYISVASEQFQNAAVEAVRGQLTADGCFSEGILDGFRIVPDNAKKTIVKVFNQNIEASIGSFILSGSPLLLEYLYDNGIGARRGAAFGLFDII